MGEHCSFGKLEEMVRDRLVCGVGDPHMQRAMLQERDLTYQKALELCMATELATIDISLLQQKPVKKSNVYILVNRVVSQEANTLHIIAVEEITPRTRVCSRQLNADSAKRSGTLQKFASLSSDNFQPVRYQRERKRLHLVE